MSRLTHEIAKLLVDKVREIGRIDRIRRWRRMHGLIEAGLSDVQILEWLLRQPVEDVKNFNRWEKEWTR